MSMTTPRAMKSSALVLAIAVALSIACGLCPGLASASQPETGQTSEQALSTQASTKTVYVITGKTETANWGIESKTTTKYSYDKNGLVTKCASSNNMDGESTTAYAYKGTTLKNMKQTNPGTRVTTTYTVNKKGLCTKAVQVNEQSNDVIFTRTFTGKYKSGELKKIDCTTVLEADGQTSTTKDERTYTYKNGHVASRTWSGSTVTYAYDAKGNLNNIGGSPYKNTYNKKGLLTKTDLSEEGYTYKKTYTYKAIEVNTSVADKVEAQQWAIINNNLNFAFGIDQ